MNAPYRPEAQNSAFKFSSSDGHALCRRILAKFLPYDPYDVQIEGISKLLDGIDLFAILQTGMGKTSFISMYMLVVLEIQGDPSLCPSAAARFPKNPCILVVLPTKYLEHQMAEIMEKIKLKTLVINSDTINDAHLVSRDLWEDAITTPQLVFLAPEQLISKGCTKLLNGDFSSRVCALVVDEAHLLNTWGKSFRKAYQQIGWVRSRLQTTMCGGEHINNVCRFLGLHENRFHLLRRSNARPEVIKEKRKTLIFSWTINLGFWVYAYLYYEGLESDPDISQHICLYNSLNWPSFNEETRQLMLNNPACGILIGTDTLAVGVDIGNIEDVIVLDEPEDIDELVQKFGRVGRNRLLVKKPRAILYTGSKTLETAQRLVENDTGQHHSQSDNETMDLSMAYMHLALCKPKEQDCQYDNPSNPPCSCHGCQLDDRPQLELDACNCSGCMESNGLQVPKGKRLTKAMRKVGTKQLLEFRLEVWESADEKTTGFLAPAIFLPDEQIKMILDYFALLHSVGDVHALIENNAFLTASHETALYDIICQMKVEKKAELQAKRQEKKKVDNTDGNTMEISSDEATGSSSNEKDECRTEGEGLRNRLVIKINQG
ncbi:P-loop containing nucleoside triphosphate hydrolase protein [Phlegmacium glaucopus]|nr:P-loop containing nucleoside triphosphate hydrolase protein [Phlegmacium glaucopus]